MKYINIKNYLTKKDLRELICFKESENSFLYFNPSSFKKTSIADMFDSEKRKEMRIIAHNSFYETIQKDGRILNPFEFTPKLYSGPIENSFYLRKD
ncbi:MAG: hypothetical protein WC260_01990 [Candidatus Pacearchaeota archaeon]